MGGARNKYGKEERRTQGFGGETYRKRPFRGPRRRWENNSKIEPPIRERVGGGGHGLD